MNSASNTVTPHEVEKPIATIRFEDAAQLSPRQREKLAQWLRKHANELVDTADQYAPHFTARFFPTPGW